MASTSSSTSQPASCTIPSSPVSNVINGPFPDRPRPSTFVKRVNSQLILDGQEYRASGGNIYWLGLDENVSPSPSYPSHERVREILATAAAMGANTIRSTTLGVNFGCGLCVESSLGVFNQNALAAIDYAIFQAQVYGIRVIFPLTDNYDYYHGGIPTFLRWRNLSDTDYGPFYDTTSTVYQDFEQYIKTLLNRTNTFSNLPYANDPTILAVETGNELGGWHMSNPPPIAWTTSVATLIKSILPNTLVLDGTYGINAAALSISAVDVYSNHFYPLYSSRVNSDAKLVGSYNKAYLVGEFDWTGKVQRYLLLIAILPALLSIGCFFLPKRWFPIPIRGRLRTSSKHTKRRSLGYHIPLSSEEQLQTPNLPKPWFHIRKWHLALFFFLWIPIVILIVWFSGPSSLGSFLDTVQNSNTAGSFYWSLFGHTNDCCGYVQHNDGYTLHFPGDDSSMQNAVESITQHAYQMTRQSANFVSASYGLNASLPSIACPQGGIT